jgi:hypothetical protein
MGSGARRRGAKGAPVQAGNVATLTPNPIRTKPVMRSMVRRTAGFSKNARAFIVTPVQSQRVRTDRVGGKQQRVTMSSWNA